MSEKKFTVRPGDEIVIKLPKKISDSRNSRKKEISPSKAMLPARRAGEFLPRRLQKGGLLNFYDVALRKNEAGEFLDWLAPIAPEIPNGANLSNLAPSAAEYAAYQNQFLSLPAAEWKDNFKSLAPEDVGFYDLRLVITAENELVALDETNEKWSGEGLKVGKIDRLAFFNYGAFNLFDTSFPAGYFKITNEPNFDAPAVAFNLTRGGDIFLLPMLARHWARVASDADYVRHLDFVWSPFRRDYYKTSGFFRFETDLDYPPGIENDDPLANQALTMLRSLPGARAFTRRNDAGGGAIAAIPVSDFPAADEAARETDISIFTTGMFAEALLAVIVASDKTFYVWAINPFPAFKGQQILSR